MSRDLGFVDKRYKKFISRFTTAQRETIHRRIVDGVNAGALTRLAQDEYGVYADEPYINVYRKMKRYTEWYLEANKQHDSRDDVLVPPNELVINAVERIDDYAQNFNGLDKLAKLCEIQENRMNVALEQEKAMSKKGFLNKVATEQIREYAKVLKDLTDFQMKAGVIALAPKIYPRIVDQPQNGREDVVTLPVTEDLRWALGKLEDLENMVTQDG